ncbi:MAG: PilX N-terminal domain-containing pilus assembly protein [Pseudomonadota bacterium]|jgi:type IV pilus assembly protein PilX|uniref:Pilus assembly protein PilX n=1 Tax=Stutzerimonas balearica DSM 6083 TaxID=1123016 RepID=A0A8D3XZD1_9GAMM|nr:PilX N-terminal domain-containing pilus assembly protein [Stutzerimonas balearica]AJE14262.1 pilus assembly protein PilX [Stutzerimonas balearica DSM 6083]SDM68063.1 type IV pilus assembly protein PilX [Stutzerimonas balearica DSM 6083]
MRNKAQSGSALIISLIFLLVLTMIGVASIQDSTLQERMAGNERDRNIAFQAAEAALRAGENHLRQAGVLFSASGTNGLISPDYTGIRPVETNYPWSERSQQVSDSFAGVRSAPRYTIEWLTTQTFMPSDEGEVPIVNSYRVTARAVGGGGDAVVVLQSTVSR